MPARSSDIHARLLLELLEMTSLGALTAEQATNRLRRGHPLSRSARRAATGLKMLAAEGLVETFRDDGLTFYRVTPSGLAALEQRGRFPGAAAVLFTDIVASTELIAKHGEDGAHTRRQRHFELLRKATAAHGGREVKSLGDGLMVIFSEPEPAVACAVDMQYAVAADDDRLGLRVGIHTGELLREGNDFFGTTVIVARRLCDAADAGQIVTSDELLEAAELADVQAESLGSLTLKGLSDPVPASEIQWRGARESVGRSRRLRFLRQSAVTAAVGG